MNSLYRGLFYSHCKELFYREFAWKTVPGIDVPNKKGFLKGIRRNRKTPVKNSDDIATDIIRYKSRPGQYISVYSFSELHQSDIVTEKGDIEAYKGSIDYESAKIDRFYLDFDNEDEPQKAIDEALIVIRSLSKHGIYCHCYFSGMKGIALYIEFRTVELKPENKKEVLRLFLDILIKTVKSDFGYTISYLDRKVSFDLSRVSRIPNTKHRSGLYCIPVTFGDMRKGLAYLKEKAQNPSMKNLESVIVKCIGRNTKLQILFQNLEKQVVLERENKIKEKEIKKVYYAKLKTLNPSKCDGLLSDEQIKHARNTPLSELITHESRMKCPIHDGDNPTSFYINHHKNYYFCHSCGKGGDPIAYIMTKNNVSFKEAVLFLNSLR